MMHPMIASALVAVATWETWRWYFGRVAASLDDGLALITVVLIVAMAGGGGPRAAHPALAAPGRPARRLPRAPRALFPAGYATGRLAAPPIARAGLAIALTLFCLHVAVLRR